MSSCSHAPVTARDWGSLLWINQIFLSAWGVLPADWKFSSKTAWRGEAASFSVPIWQAVLLLRWEKEMFTVRSSLEFLYFSCTSPNRDCVIKTNPDISFKYFDTLSIYILHIFLQRHWSFLFCVQMFGLGLGKDHTTQYIDGSQNDSLHTAVYLSR